jgi:hypothetical protein
MNILVAILIGFPLVCSILFLSACVVSGRVNRASERTVRTVKWDEELPAALTVSSSPR